MRRPKPVRESGPWTPHKATKAGQSISFHIQSEDFHHDASLAFSVSGDFGSDEKKWDYVQEIAYRLNTWEDKRHLAGYLPSADALGLLAAEPDACLESKCKTLRLFSKADGALYIQKLESCAIEKAVIDTSFLKNYLWNPQHVPHPFKK